MLSNEQNGFRPRRSCLDHIFSLQDICQVRKNLGLETFLVFIDFRKAFDCVEHTFLLHKLRQKGIDGNVYHAVKCLYSDPISCVRVGRNLTDWFPVSTGVRQGDSLSPVLFSIFIDDLAQEIKELNCGVQVGGLEIPLLLYADDVVLLSSSRSDTQKQLDALNKWCRKWWLSINTDKSKVMHVRNHQRPRCNEPLYCGEEELAYVETYKYLGIFFHECLSPKQTVEALTASASRSFGRIVNMFRKLQNMGIRTYETLYHSYVEPIMNYGAAVWGYGDYSDPQVLQNRIMRYFLGCHKFAPTPAVQIEMDWLCTRFQRWVEMVRFRNRLASMPESRLPRVIYNWDKSLKTNAWARSVDMILHYVNLPDENENLVHTDLDVVKARLIKLNREKWWAATADMTKLRTYRVLYDEQDYKGLVYANLTRRQRSLLTKFKLGILPLGIEVGRFTDVPLEYRLCQVCKEGLLEDEFHFILYCEGLKDTRSRFFEGTTYLEDVEDVTDKVELCKLLFNSHNLKHSARFLEAMFDARLRALYK